MTATKNISQSATVRANSAGAVAAFAMLIFQAFGIDSFDVVEITQVVANIFMLVAFVRGIFTRISATAQLV